MLSTTPFNTSVQDRRVEWPEPKPLDPKWRIHCKDKAAVVNAMFMRRGGRDPLEGYTVSEDTWHSLKDSRWTFGKAPDEMRRDWEHDFPVSRSPTAIGPGRSDGVTAKWFCLAPLAAFSDQVSGRECYDRKKMDPRAA